MISRISTVRTFVAITLGAIVLSCLAACGMRSVASAPAELTRQSVAGLDSQPIQQNVPARLMTWDAIGGMGGSGLVTPAMATGWLDWVLTPPSLSVPFKAVGIKTAFYADPNRTRPGDPMFTKDETTFAHDCFGRRIKVQPNPLKGTLLMDPHSHHLWSLWHQEVTTVIGEGAQFDAIFEDTADELHKALATPCHFNQTDWTNQTNSMDSNLGYPIVYNALAGTDVTKNPPAPSPAIGINRTTIGGMAEDCYVTYNPSPVSRLQWWEAMENTEIQMMAQHKLFICMGDSYDDAAQNTYERIYWYASILMTYDPSYLIGASLFGDPLNFHVFPEEQFVALQPVVAQPTVISKLLLPSGVYGREYKACYFKGKLVGPCAVAVDDDSTSQAPKPFPWPNKYHHTLNVHGYDVLDGGTAGVAGPAPPAQMNNGSAVIAIGP
jgi:hypothetical protein